MQERLEAVLRAKIHLLRMCFLTFLKNNILLQNVPFSFLCYFLNRIRSGEIENEICIFTLKCKDNIFIHLERNVI